MRLVILDRDGVINHDSDRYIKSADEWVPLPGSVEAIAKLCRHGFRVAVATNQSGLGRGYFSSAELTAMHDKLRSLVAAAGGEIAGIFYCPHTPGDGCECRKPAPGLLDQIARAFALDSLQGIPVVGDSIRDLQAGAARHCQPILVRTGKGQDAERKLDKYPELATVPVFDNLAAAADYLCER